MKPLSIIIIALALCTGCTEFNQTSSPPKESYTDECTFRIEQIHFISKGDTIRGSIVFPKEIQPCPAVVLIPGSGKSMRLTNYAKKFASKGIAALTYDKRGIGESEGRYRNRGNASKKNLNLLAKDVLAAVSLLSNHSGIDADCIGLWSFSQGGWIAPIVISQSDDIRFSVLMSSPAVPVSMEMKYSRIAARNPKLLDVYSLTEIDSILLHESIHNRIYRSLFPAFDPLPYFHKIDIPVLWIFGGQDLSIPVNLCIRQLNTLENSNTEIWQYPECGHSLKLPDGPSVPANKITFKMIDWIQELNKQSDSQEN